MAPFEEESAVSSIQCNVSHINKNEVSFEVLLYPPYSSKLFPVDLSYRPKEQIL